MNQRPTSPFERRSFLARLTAGGALVAGIAGFGAQPAAQSAGASPFQPAKHPEDEWFDLPAAKHRLYLDTTTVHGVAEAVFYSNNFLNASRSGYRLTDSDSSVVIGLRHESTPFAFADAMWVKYGKAFSEHAAGFNDPKTNQLAVINILRNSSYNMLPNRGVTIDAVTARGVRFAVCSLATRAIASVAARQLGGAADDVVKDLTSNLVPNAHMVPAGIVALSRAQERGYTFGYVE